MTESANAAVFFGGWYGSAIGRANTNGSQLNANLITSKSPNPTGMVVRGDHLFWMNNALPIRLSRSRLDGTGVRSNVVTVRGPTELSAGPWISGSKVYWATPFRTRGGGFRTYLGRSNINGSRLQRKYLALPKSMTSGLHVADGYVFASRMNSSFEFTEIVRMRLTGRHKRSTFAGISNSAEVTSRGGFLYWHVSGSIYRAPTNGLGSPEQLATTACDVNSLAVNSTHLFWDCGTEIAYMNLDGTRVTALFSSGFDLNGGGMVLAANDS